MNPTGRHVGASTRRIEDPALLRGLGRFADDIVLPEMLHAHFVRSQVAHGRLVRIDCAAARTLPGVHAVYTFADLAPHLALPRIPMAMPSAAIRHHLDPTVLAHQAVHHVGEAVALVIADSRAVAEDAAALVDVSIEILDPVVDPRLGLQPGAPRARLDCPDNLVARQTVGYGDCAAAFAAAPHVLREKIWLHKGGGHSIECRGIVARQDPGLDQLVVWDGTQMPHRAHDILCRTLGLAEQQVRVIAPDVGGGFGPKFVFYPEEITIPLAARLLRRPVKWIEDRYESFIATTQERDQFWDIEVAADGDGRLMGIRGTLIHDHGAYSPYGVALPYNAATNLIGPYRLPAYKLDLQLCLTNKVPATPTRGAGRPQGTFVMERLLDRIADALGMGRDEVRRRNLIAPDAMPYVTGVATRDGGVMTYDSGDYPKCQALALEHAGWTAFPERQAKARAEGRYIGLGLANYVEGSGRGPFETATVRVGPSGRVVVQTGATSQGQGIKTALAQICADQLGIPIEAIDVVAGDTGVIATGLGAFASRQAVTAGSATHQAGEIVRAKILKAASAMLEASEGDLELRNGRVEHRGVPGSGKSLAEIARALQGLPGYGLPGRLPPGLDATVSFEPAAMTYCNGTHLCEVEVDIDTGMVRIVHYVVVHDCGRMINPMIVEGQVRGGVVHGIGNALFEWMRYDDDGQPLTTQYSDYLLATAPELPPIEIHHLESPTPLNPLGAKGAGEGGTIPAAAAVVSAIEDALRPFGLRLMEAPLTPMRLLALLDAAHGRQAP